MYWSAAERELEILARCLKALAKLDATAPPEVKEVLERAIALEQLLEEERLNPQLLRNVIVDMIIDANKLIEYIRFRGYPSLEDHISCRENEGDNHHDLC